MKNNRSLGISNAIEECKMGNIIGLLEKEFEVATLAPHLAGADNRKKVFTPLKTLLTMVLTSVQQDKTLKNSVDLYYGIHQQERRQVLEGLEAEMQAQKQLDLAGGPAKVGRPRNYEVRLPKSLEKDISLNTAAYSKARGRVPMELAQGLFRASRIEKADNPYSHWHGHRVMTADGTYVQMQDTKSLRQAYQIKCKDGKDQGYPQGLLEVIFERGTGQVHNFGLSDRHTSELSLLYTMIDDLAPKTLLLADDLYNCYEILAKCKRKGVELVVPAKRRRNYEVMEILGEGDEIIKIKVPKNRSKWLEENETAKHLLLRRIACKSPEGKDYVMHTTILDKKIGKEEIQLLYLTRWDIEIGIREVKTIMDVNILRSKTPEMVLKELTVALATYNFIRKIIYASIKTLPFSPKEDFIQKLYTLNKDVLVDKKGRVYNRWSTGRRRTGETYFERNAPQAKTGQEI